MLSKRQKTAQLILDEVRMRLPVAQRAPERLCLIQKRRSLVAVVRRQ
jgi:hypothetical protein